MPLRPAAGREFSFSNAFLEAHLRLGSHGAPCARSPSSASLRGGPAGPGQRTPAPAAPGHPSGAGPAWGRVGLPWSRRAGLTAPASQGQPLLSWLSSPRRRQFHLRRIIYRLGKVLDDFASPENGRSLAGAARVASSPSQASLGWPAVRMRGLRPEIVFSPAFVVGVLFFFFLTTMRIFF